MKDGGPAFPHAAYVDNGMSLRDYFAAAVLTGLLADARRFSSDWEKSKVIVIIANHCYEVADAMLAERAKEQK